MRDRSSLFLVSYYVTLHFSPKTKIDTSKSPYLWLNTMHRPIWTSSLSLFLFNSDWKLRLCLALFCTSRLNSFDFFLKSIITKSSARFPSFFRFDFFQFDIWIYGCLLCIDKVWAPVIAKFYTYYNSPYHGICTLQFDMYICKVHHTQSFDLDWVIAICEHMNIRTDEQIIDHTIILFFLFFFFSSCWLDMNWAASM